MSVETFADYQQATQRTAKKLNELPEKEKLLYIVGQLSSEAGEVAGLIAKAALRGHPVDSLKLREEAGDVLWFIATLLEHYGIEMEVCAEENIRKLRKRFAEGYSVEADVARKDVV